MSKSTTYVKKVQITSQKCDTACLLACMQKHQHHASMHVVSLKEKRRVFVPNDKGKHPGGADLPSGQAAA